MRQSTWELSGDILEGFNKVFRLGTETQRTHVEHVFLSPNTAAGLELGRKPRDDSGLVPSKGLNLIKQCLKAVIIELHEAEE